MPRGESYNFAAAEAERSEKQKREREQMVETLAPADSTQERLARLKQWLEDEQKRAESGKERKFSFFRKRGSALEAAKRGRALSALRDLLNRAEDEESQEDAQKWAASAMIEAMRLGYAHLEKDESDSRVKVVYEERAKERTRSRGKKKRTADTRLPKAAPTARGTDEVRKEQRAEVVESVDAIKEAWEELESAPGNDALKKKFEFKTARDARGVKATMSLKEEYQSAEPFHTVGVQTCLGDLVVSVRTPTEMKEFAAQFSEGFASPDIQNKVLEVVKSLPTDEKALSSDSINTLTQEIGEPWVGAVIALIEAGTAASPPEQETDEEKYGAFMATEVEDEIWRHLYEKKELDEYIYDCIRKGNAGTPDFSFDKEIRAVCESLKQAAGEINWNKEGREQKLLDRIKPLAQARCAERAVEIVEHEGTIANTPGGGVLSTFENFGKNIVAWDALTEEGRTVVLKEVSENYETVFNNIFKEADTMYEQHAKFRESFVFEIIIIDVSITGQDIPPVSELIDFQNGIYPKPAIRLLDTFDSNRLYGGALFPLLSMEDVQGYLIQGLTDPQWKEKVAFIEKEWKESQEQGEEEEGDGLLTVLRKQDTFSEYPTLLAGAIIALIKEEGEAREALAKEEGAKREVKILKSPAHDNFKGTEYIGEIRQENNESVKDGYGLLVNNDETALTIEGYWKDNKGDGAIVESSSVTPQEFYLCQDGQIQEGRGINISQNQEDGSEFLSISFFGKPEGEEEARFISTGDQLTSRDDLCEPALLNYLNENPQLKADKTTAYKELRTAAEEILREVEGSSHSEHKYLKKLEEEYCLNPEIIKLYFVVRLRELMEQKSYEAFMKTAPQEIEKLLGDEFTQKINDYILGKLYDDDGKPLFVFSDELARMRDELKAQAGNVAWNAERDEALLREAAARARERCVAIVEESVAETENVSVLWNIKFMIEEWDGLTEQKCQELLDAISQKREGIIKEINKEVEEKLRKAEVYKAMTQGGEGSAIAEIVDTGDKDIEDNGIALRLSNGWERFNALNIQCGGKVPFNRKEEVDELIRGFNSTELAEKVEATVGEWEAKTDKEGPGYRFLLKELGIGIMELFGALIAILARERENSTGQGVENERVTEAGGDNKVSLVLQQEGGKTETMEVDFETSRLDLSNKNLTAIPNLSRFGNLTKLDLSGNRITDISPLSRVSVSSVGLISLELRGNPIETIPCEAVYVLLKTGNQHLFINQRVTMEIRNEVKKLMFDAMGDTYNKTEKGAREVLRNLIRERNYQPTADEKELVDLYNKNNTDAFFKKYDGIIRLGAERGEPVFKEDTSGNFWAIQLEGKDAVYAVPRLSLTFSSLSFLQGGKAGSGMVNVFDCPEFDVAKRYRNVKVIKPALFEYNSASGSFVLKETGILDLGEGE